jgi:hypothetical protein
MSINRHPFILRRRIGIPLFEKYIRETKKTPGEKKLQEF